MGEGKTYTVNDGDTVARQYNPVDASAFDNRYEMRPEDNCPYEVKKIKTPIKIYRQQYHHATHGAEKEPWFLSNPFIDDSSAEYGLKDSVCIDTDTEGTVYLCAYMSAQDWMPVARARAQGGTVCFKNVGNNLVCLPVTIEGDKKTALSCPVLIIDSKIVRTYKPSHEDNESIRINRKYPLCSYTTDVWSGIRGGVFEGANTADFAAADTLAEVMTMPYGMTRYKVSQTKKYRYLRYKSADTSRSSLSEVQFLSDGDILKGRILFEGIDEKTVQQLFDGNTATACRGLSAGYHVGIDLGAGNERSITETRLSPSTDLNFVERGHLYELYYFDTEWHMIGRKTGEDGYLEFGNVPANSLLLLKDRTAGREERIFTYESDKQVWY